MYAEFFGLKQNPFSIAPDPRYLFMSERHREALAHLLFGVQGGGGFVLLTGEIGTGKTTICRCFLEQMPDNCHVAYIYNPKLTVPELLATVCHEFQIPIQPADDGEPAGVKRYFDPLNQYLLERHAAGQNSVLVIDEAQNLSADVLEQLRLLTNLETSERKLLQIILIGQPELRALLARPELEQLAQRVIARFHLGTLSAAETRQYIEHRMRVAGLATELPFDAAALKRIHKRTGGVPRRINLLCDRALLGAFGQSQRQVDTRIVERAAAEVFDTPGRPRTPQERWHLAKPLLVGTLFGVLITLGCALTWQRLHQVDRASAQVLPDAAKAAAQAAPAPKAQAATQPPTKDQTPAAVAPPEETTPPRASDLYPGESAALAALASVWPLRPLDANPCASALQQQHQCYRIARMTLHGLREFDRPAVVRLRFSGRASGYAVLTHLSDSQATLNAQGRSWTLPLKTLAELWKGDYATFWRTPEGQTGHLANGMAPATAPWLEARLDQLQTQGALPRDARTLSDKVAAFQRTHGIDVNGRASPTMMILLNRATLVDEPRLQDNPH